MFFISPSIKKDFELYEQKKSSTVWVHEDLLQTHILSFSLTRNLNLKANKNVILIFNTHYGKNIQKLLGILKYHLPFPLCSIEHIVLLLLMFATVTNKLKIM